MHIEGVFLFSKLDEKPLLIRFCPEKVIVLTHDYSIVFHITGPPIKIPLIGVRVILAGKGFIEIQI